MSSSTLDFLGSLVVIPIVIPVFRESLSYDLTKRQIITKRAINVINILSLWLK